MGDEEVIGNHDTCLFLWGPSPLVPRLSCGTSTTYRALVQVVPLGWPRTAKSGSFLDGRRNERDSKWQGDTHHIIHDTSTIVASLRALKKRMSSSPSEPSFFRATPNTRAKRTNPKMFIPSISVPMGICRIRADKGSKFTTDEWELKNAFAPLSLPDWNTVPGRRKGSYFL